MKRKFIKFLLPIVGLAVLFFAGLYWPLQDLKVPIKHGTILIKSVTVIDVVSGALIENQDIIIKGNRITEIGMSDSINSSNDAFVIDGLGKFVIPGLWDMHTHSNQHSEWLHHPLYIANGVTGIRDMSGQLNEKDSYWVGSKERLHWNTELNNNERITPRYVLQSSYQIDGSSSVPENFPDFFKLEKDEHVDSLLSFYKNEKVDFIKVYQQIQPNIYKKLALAAPKYKLHLAGHKPMFVSLKDAILLGQRSFEHGRIFMFESFPKADSLRNPKNWKALFSKFKKSMIEDFNPEIAIKLMTLMKENNAYWTPTLQTLKFEAFAHKSTFIDNPNLKYITSIRKNIWWGIDVKNNKKKNLSEEGNGLSTDFYNAAKKQIKMAKDIGVPIMTGTDVTDSYTFAGFSIHNELEDLTKSGLSNLETLQSATIIPAKFVGKEKEYGTIENGKIADLIILNKNPLENIVHSKTINGVVMNGTYYDSDKLNELKNFTQSISSSFHMNIKVFYSLISSPLVRVQFAD
ncbi:amidohydrolase family protein [Psychroserpens ponticola]|uniref:Amidohydrolase family protein n=1 Tax=Psychroserpens ponticola TaxID=2932268 RepID=A0ABY7RZG3_9FLAO|nr:amidohydrolase family protein [Psychroserpens ponticola]WCO02299.1 amidohydrolase family protein [Psychroserpens ponticola]